MAIDTFDSNIDQWFYDSPTGNHESHPFAVSRVMTYLRESNKDCYEPQLVSIGPYHHRTVKLQPMVAHKRRYFRDFLARNNSINLGSHIHKMRTHEACARRCYNEKTDLTSDEFVEMLLVDGCFILELSFKLQRGLDELLIVGWDRMALLSDIFLLENQIPYFVLEKLVDGLNIDLKELLTPIFVNFVGEEMPFVQNQSPQGSTHHLLHLYHQLFMPSRGNNRISQNGSGNNRSVLLIPNASQLQDFGIGLMKKTLASDILDITRISSNVIAIPPFVIDSNLKTTYMNLLAFEESLDPTERRLTSFVLLMASIIQTPEDIKILEDKGILASQLSSNEEDVLCFFTDLRRLVSFDQLKEHYFAGLFSEINQSCEGLWCKYRASLKRDYFNEPWSMVSFVGTTYALAFSAIQTVFTNMTYRHPS